MISDAIPYGFNVFNQLYFLYYRLKNSQVEAVQHTLSVRKIEDRLPEINFFTYLKCSLRNFGKNYRAQIYTEQLTH